MSKQPLGKSSRARLARLIVSEARTLLPGDVGISRDTFNELIREFRLVAVHPFGEPTHWVAGAKSLEIAMELLADIERYQLAQKAERAASAKRQALYRKIQRCARAGLLALPPQKAMP
jgi:hypothetical protein